MKVEVDCLDGSKGIVYCRLSCAGEPIITASFDYVVSYCNEQGYTIENAQDVLWWIHRNCELQAM